MRLIAGMRLRLPSGAVIILVGRSIVERQVCWTCAYAVRARGEVTFSHDFLRRVARPE